MHNGDCKDKVDLLFIAEGYTKEQMDKFRADAQRMTDYMFSMHPYSKHKEDFNIWIVESLSAEEGTD
ncbi:MAG: peptidase M64, partial [Bacteroidales bacterium]|nr:peptidase M64 [Bacteroidales bacterium]